MLSKGCPESYARESESWLSRGRATSQPGMGKQVSDYLGLRAVQTNLLFVLFCIRAIFIGLWIFFLFPGMLTLKVVLLSLEH